MQDFFKEIERIRCKRCRNNQNRDFETNLIWFRGMKRQRARCKSNEEMPGIGENGGRSWNSRVGETWKQEERGEELWWNKVLKEEDELKYLRESEAVMIANLLRSILGRHVSRSSWQRGSNGQNLYYAISWAALRWEFQKSILLGQVVLKKLRCQLEECQDHPAY